MATARAQSPSASSTGGDADAVDVGLAEIELQKLQRQFRLMEGDRKAYSDESRLQITKQRIAITSLRRENDELRSELRLLERRRDAAIKKAQEEGQGMEGGKVKRMEEEADLLLRRLRASSTHLARLTTAMSNCDRKLAAAKADEIAAGPRGEHEEKARRVLENRLDKSLAKFSTSLSHNKLLRSTVDSLRRDRGVYDTARHRLEREIHSLKAGMAETIEASNNAYETRDDAQSRLLTLREKADKEYQAYLVEMKDLGRILEQDRKLKEFMATKAADRTAIARERMSEIRARQEEKIREERAAAGGDGSSIGGFQKPTVGGTTAAPQAEQARYDLEEVLAELRKVSGVDAVSEMVAKFCEMEDSSFSLFNHVNEVQNEGEKMNDEILHVVEDMRKLEEADRNEEEERGRRMAAMERALEGDKARAERYRERATEVAAGLGGLLAKVDAIVATVRAFEPLDRGKITFTLPVELAPDPLGPSDTPVHVTVETVLAYLKFAEGKANEMLLANYLLSVPRKKDGEDGAGEDSGLTETEAKEKERKEKEALGGLLGRGPTEAFGEIKPIAALPTGWVQSWWNISVCCISWLTLRTLKSEDYDSAEEVDRPLMRADFERMATEKLQKKHSAKSAAGGVGAHGTSKFQGNGLGRSHALFFASRGAKVVVNDLGGSGFGTGQSTSAADKVVEEIRAAGGNAVANYDSVEFGDKIIETAMKAYGRIDVVVNNAGILRDKSFARMTEEDWAIIQKVHVYGSYKVAKAAWEIMEKQKFGRIINTASGAGVYGNFGQVNYSTAKLAVHGLTETLAQEGAKNNILVNTIAPLAGSRLTATVWDEAMLSLMKPDYISPLVAYLAHESSTATGRLFELGGGWISEIRWNKTKGKVWNTGPSFTPSAVAASWDKVEDFTDSTYPRTNRDGISALEIIETAKKSPPNPQGPPVRFDGKVVVITGAGNGLGKAYAKLFGKLGAKVVVNDLGGGAFGGGADTRPAQVVADEIVAAGGVAVPNFDNVLEGHKIIETAIKSFGRIDILINNAGILRDKSFRRMTDDVKRTYHYPFYVCNVLVVWNFISSTFHLHSNYAAAKIGTIGFTNALSKEGAKYNVRVLSVAPAAGTRLTATVMPQEMLDLLSPDFVAQPVAYLASDLSTATGTTYEINAGWAAKLRWQRTGGAYFDFKGFTAEDVRDNWDKITNFNDGRATNPSTPADSFPEIMKNPTIPPALFPPRRAAKDSKAKI
ncbi:hypothetical protein HDU93_009213 [Gonapodya sp. JEL0774]|nr:hypothetical protein HDU93_009213 [Gonapodya sp. JEL0774]